MLFLRACLMFQMIPLVSIFLPPCASARSELDTVSFLSKMETVYAQVDNYQVSMEVRNHSGDGSYETQEFLYTFKKPKWIRIDFKSPHLGMVLVYPDRDGKVVIRPSGWADFLKLRFSPDSYFLKVSSGQQIDQTDLGLLIKNIRTSLTNGRLGEAEWAEDTEHIKIRVLAANHFREGVATLYRFFIDKKAWLPVMVEEFSSKGSLERVIIFHGLRTNIHLSDNFFQVNGG